MDRYFTIQEAWANRKRAWDCNFFGVFKFRIQHNFPWNFFRPITQVFFRKSAMATVQVNAVPKIFPYDREKDIDVHNFHRNF